MALVLCMYEITLKEAEVCTKSLYIELSQDLKDHIFVKKIQIDSKRRLIIGNFYRSPSSSNDNNMKLNEAIARAVKNTKDPVLLVGDFNYGDINFEPHGNTR